MISDLIKSKHVNGALFNLRQLHFGIFDMTIHEPKSHAEVESFKFTEMYNKLNYDICHLDSPAQIGGDYEWGKLSLHFPSQKPLTLFPQVTVKLPSVISSEVTTQATTATSSARSTAQTCSIPSSRKIP